MKTKTENQNMRRVRVHSRSFMVLALNCPQQFCRLLSGLVATLADRSRHRHPSVKIVPYLSPMSQSSHRVRSPVERARCQVPTHRGPQRAASFIFAPFAIFCKTVRNRIKAPLCQNKFAPVVARRCMQLRANPYTPNFPPKTCAMFCRPHSPLRGPEKMNLKLCLRNSELCTPQVGTSLRQRPLLEGRAPRAQPIQNPKSEIQNAIHLYLTFTASLPI
jgi:hypothetical protein